MDDQEGQQEGGQAESRMTITANPYEAPLQEGVAVVQASDGYEYFVYVFSVIGPSFTEEEGVMAYLVYGLPAEDDVPGKRKNGLFYISEAHRAMLKEIVGETDPPSLDELAAAG